LDNALREAEHYKLLRDEERAEKNELRDALKGVYSQVEQAQDDGTGPDLDSLDVLEQLYSNLEQLRDDVEETEEDPRRKAKHDLAEMRGPLSDLAEDLDSDELREAHTLLAVGVDKVRHMESERGPILDVIDELISDMDAQISKHPAAKTRRDMKQTPGGFTAPTRGESTEMHMGVPAPISTSRMSPIGDDRDGRDRRKHGLGSRSGLEPTPVETPYQRKAHVQKFKFERDFPMIKRIKIEGPWINRYPVAEMEHRGEKFRRKLKFFKWLHRMLVLSVDFGDHVPDLGPDLPESHWPETYLKRRKKELNLFLMQCDSIPWIRKHEAYQLFINPEVESMKKATHALDKRLVADYKKSKRARLD
jgi:hypothetical protein